MVVCIKQVPDSREIRIDPVSNTLIREGVPAIVNIFDLHGVEEAVRIKERIACTRVTVLTMGPKSARSALQECISLGADEGVLVSDRAFAGADTLATSYVLAEAIRMAAQVWGPVDLVICGKQTLDGDTGQVGPGIAARLDLEQLTYVERIRSVDPDAGRITVERHLEDGVEVVETSLPALVTVVEGINEVRRASMPGMLRAVRYEPLVWTVADFPEIDRSRLGLKGSPTVVGKAWVPEPITRSGEALGGPDGDGNGNDSAAQVAAAQLFDRLLATDLPARLGWTGVGPMEGSTGSGTRDPSPHDHAVEEGNGVAADGRGR
ncbi:electron transfer flavoprotein subunit beta/FixA family protein [Limnochorda pilosa]|uniref:electron transfer flavoprotein subunit beta/FixA family protein n=1 Tax=Limnochorda pilosa TaxID=1555112 RepID=UPI001E43203F|nr:electron transfer flavoprotein subunit beta/FixA family protein [Limnochorda pilosa]